MRGGLVQHREGALERGYGLLEDGVEVAERPDGLGGEEERRHETGELADRAPAVDDAAADQEEHPRDREAAADLQERIEPGPGVRRLHLEARTSSKARSARPLR
jgi:hypothetical protein